MKIYPPEILRLLTPEGFNEAFEEELPKHDTHESAYWAVEEIHMDYFTASRYSDFQSFKVQRSRYLKKRRKNAVK